MDFQRCELLFNRIERCLVLRQALDFTGLGLQAAGAYAAAGALERVRQPLQGRVVFLRDGCPHPAGGIALIADIAVQHFQVKRRLACCTFQAKRGVQSVDFRNLRRLSGFEGLQRNG